MDKERKIKYPDKADNIDMAIIDVIANSSHPMSRYSLHHKFMKNINFEQRLDNITATCPEYMQWSQKKLTPQIGTKEQFEEIKDKIVKE